MKKIICFIAILFIACLSIYYIYFSLYGKPKEIILAEEQLKKLMKAPETFKIDEVEFLISMGTPTMFIKYTSSNSFGVPLAGTALYTYKCKSDITNDHEEVRLAQERAFNRIKERINSGSQIEEPFEFCSLSIIDLNGKELDKNSFIIATAGSYSLEKELDNRKIFLPMSKIGGKINKLNDDGTIEAQLDHYKYFPGKLFSWE